MPLRALFLSLVAAGLLLDATGADAQNFRRPTGRQKPKTERFAADGSVVAIAPGRVQIHTVSNQNWMVWIAPEAVIHVLGTAEPDFVRTGICVRFTADIDKKGKTKEPVEQLSLFTPTQHDPIGIWPEGMAPSGEEPKDRGQAMGGMGMADGIQGGTVANNRDQPVPTFARYTVAGQITRARSGKFTVNCGRGLVEFQLAQQPEIRVDMADYSVVKPNDRVTVTKGKMFPGQIGIAQARELTFELSEPLTLRKKEPVRTVPSRTGPSRTRPGEPRQPFGGEGAGE
ncbi:MAG: hypothetical protein V3R99_07525 [Thermoguttaceae bacterium]